MDSKENSVKPAAHRTTRKMMDFAPRRAISNKVISAPDPKRAAIKDQARAIEERRQAIRRQIQEQNEQDQARRDRFNAAREDLAKRQAAEAARRRQVEIERRREEERRRKEAELQTNLEYEEDQRRRRAAAEVARREAAERAAEQAERRKQYEALLRRQEAAEAKRQAEKRAEKKAAAPKATSIAVSSPEKRQASRPSAHPANHSAVHPTARPGINAARTYTDFPRRTASDPAHISAPGSHLSQKPHRKTTVDVDDGRGIDSRRLGSLDDFESEFNDLEAEEDLKASFAEDRDKRYEPKAKPRRRAEPEDDLDDIDDEDTSLNNTSYVLGGRSPFINTDKVEKRALGSSARIRELARADEMPHKNIYARRVASSRNERDVPTVVVDNDEGKGSNLSLIIAIVLTVILGAAVGTVAYLAFFQ